MVERKIELENSELEFDNDVVEWLEQLDNVRTHDLSALIALKESAPITAHAHPDHALLLDIIERGGIPTYYEQKLFLVT